MKCSMKSMFNTRFAMASPAEACVPCDAPAGSIDAIARVEEQAWLVSSSATGRSRWVFEDAADVGEIVHRGGSRSVVAARSVGRGCRVLRDRSAAASPRLEKCRDVCWVCLRKSSIVCKGCLAVSWCSEACKARTAGVDGHDCALVCKLVDMAGVMHRASKAEAAPELKKRDAAVAEATAIARDVDFDALLLASRLDAPVPGLVDHRDLLIARSRDDDAAHAALRAARVGGSILSRMRDRDDAYAALVEVQLLQIRFNAFPLDCAGLASAGLALFPRGAALNHSCEPNVWLSIFAADDDGEPGCAFEARYCGDAPTLEQGTELLCSYLRPRVLLATRAQRRHALKASFFFACACARCERNEADRPTSKRPLEVGVAFQNLERDPCLGAVRDAVDAVAVELGKATGDGVVAARLAGRALDRAACGAARGAMRADLRLLAAQRLAKSKRNKDAAAVAESALEDLAAALAPADPKRANVARFAAKLRRDAAGGGAAARRVATAAHARDARDGYADADVLNPPKPGAYPGEKHARTAMYDNV